MSLIQTPHLKPNQVERRWFLLDADGVSLGRLASMAAQLLRGKGKPSYSPHMDLGDAVVVINAQKLQLTGNKAIQKIDFRASGYPGGQVYTNYGKLLQEKPARVVELAVYGMLPKNRLRDHFMRRLKVFRADEGLKRYGGAIPVDMKNRKTRMGGPFVLPYESNTNPAEAGGKAS
ncbi:MAG: 50S ribosomal protein L13 [Elusimicrobia bacterium]|nr:50S ribosomal protein L13 [Elusimicrobiota bacterium]